MSLLIYRAVSFDGGQTWPDEFNGPWNIEPFPYGDNPGVRADEFGNIWYCTTDDTDLLNIPVFAVSLTRWWYYLYQDL